jgi:hypothetical protein
MTMHYQGYAAVDGSWTACGVWSPDKRHPSPYYGQQMMVNPLRQTSHLSDVTCKRCWKSEAFRKAQARLDLPLDDPRGRAVKRRHVAAG